MNVVRPSRQLLPKAGGIGGGSVLNKNNNGLLDTSSSATNNNSINFYQEIPTVELSLDDFEEFALERLMVRTVQRV
jgi:hypothetical protein